MFKKMFLVLSLMFTFMVVAAPTGAVFAASVIDNSLLDKSQTYDPNNANAARVNAPLKTIVQVVGGVGGTCFVLAVMYYAIMIIFGSLNPQKSATYWKALLGCAAGAFVFFGAATFADLISGMSTPNVATKTP
jgi:type IV secretory pathway VirB2 component (pilin)